MEGVKKGQGVWASGDADDQGARGMGKVVVKYELADAGLEGRDGPPVR